MSKAGAFKPPQVALSVCLPSCGSVAAFLLAIGLLLDVAVFERPMLTVEAHHHWWGFEKRGCMLAERKCVREAVLAQGGAGVGGSQPSLMIWKEEAQTEHECIDRALRYWSLCADPIQGLVAVSFRTTGRSSTLPTSSDGDLSLHAKLRLSIRGGVRLARMLSFGGSAWIAELCGVQGCGALELGTLFCDGGVAMMDAGGWPLTFCASCGALSDRANACSSDSKSGLLSARPVSQCSAMRCEDSRPEACSDRCALVRHAHNTFEAAITIIVITWLGVVGSILFGWCKHAGCFLAAVALLACAALPISVSILRTADVAKPLAEAAMLELDGNWEPGAGLLEILASMVSLVVASLITIVAAKNSRRESSRYVPVEGNHESYKIPGSWLFGRKAIGMNDAPPPPIQGFEPSGYEEQISMADGVLTIAAPVASPAPAAVHESAKKVPYVAAEDAPGQPQPGRGPAARCWEGKEEQSDSEEVLDIDIDLDEAPSRRSSSSIGVQHAQDQEASPQIWGRPLNGHQTQRGRRHGARIMFDHSYETRFPASSI